MIVLGPGSLYTSIIPNFLVDGISEAIRSSGAVREYILNIMTQDGETDGYTGEDHVRALLEHAGGDVIDVCIANNAPVPEKWLAPYRQEGVGPIEVDRAGIEALGVAVREFPLCRPGRYIRHDADALSRAILSVWREFEA